MTTQTLDNSEDSIDLWLAYYQELDDEIHEARLRALLSEAERAQEPRYFFADDRKCHLVTRALVRTVLSRYAPVAPCDWAFDKNEYGCPHIAPDILAACAEAQGLRFNISHTRGLIALAVTRNRALGVDVENMATRAVSLGIADRFFSPVEVADLGQVPAHAQQDSFFEYWTFKESYIKARGMGLSLPLDRFSFHYPDANAVRITIDPSLDDDAGRWSFWQCRPGPEYLLALCVERRPGPPPKIHLRRLLPLLDEDALIAEFTRRSSDQD
jgi:4'-phosphopantetheinyl transferase